MALHVDIKKNYGNFTLEVAFETSDEIFAVLGESGCGKSLTLKCIAGIERPDSGRIVLDNQVLFDSEKNIDLPPQKRRVGYLFQHYALFPNMTVAENIGAALPKDKRPAAVARFLRDFSLEGLENQKPDTLSGGQQQRVALARMLAAEPRLILLDEPFSALDHNLRMAMEMEILDIFAQYRTPMLFVSHNRDEVFSLAHRLVIIHDGRVDCTGTKEEVFKSPATVAGARITGCKNIAAVIQDLDGNWTCPAWKLPGLPTPPAGCTHLGIRAHDIALKADPKALNTKGTVVRTLSFPFEGNLLVDTGGAGKAEETLVIAVSREILAASAIGESVDLSMDTAALLWLK
jgi:molybdate transport system ATP-binding protein